MLFLQDISWIARTRNRKKEEEEKLFVISLHLDRRAGQPPARRLVADLLRPALVAPDHPGAQEQGGERATDQASGVA